MGFKSFQIQQQSVLSGFAAGVSPFTVVNLGYSCVTVATVCDGVVVPGSVLKKSFGGLDLDFLLATLLE